MAGIFIFLLLCLVGFKLISALYQRTKVVVAKTSIAQYAYLLETIKGDINYYPPDINQTLESLTYSTPPSGYERGWHGPYLDKIPIDPWGTPYFYRLTYGVIFGPEICQRFGGGPFDQTFTFQAIPGKGRIVVENMTKIVHAGRIWLNGAEVVSPQEFQKDIPRIEKKVTLLASNTLRVRLESNPNHYILVSITSPFSRKVTYLVGSYGADGEPGGNGFAGDLYWFSGQSSSGT